PPRRRVRERTTTSTFRDEGGLMAVGAFGIGTPITSATPFVGPFGVSPSSLVSVNPLSGPQIFGQSPFGHMNAGIPNPYAQQPVQQIAQLLQILPQHLQYLLQLQYLQHQQLQQLLQVVQAIPVQLAQIQQTTFPAFAPWAVGPQGLQGFQSFGAQPA